MCFSPEADLVGGVVICAIGVDVLRHLKGRRDHLGIALLPVLFGLHQLTESLVWWGADGSVPHGLATTARWLYLFFAFVVLPTYVPASIWMIEAPGLRRRLMAGLTAAGALVSLSLLVAMIVGPVTARAKDHHIAYGTSLQAGLFIVGLYVLVTCGAPILSGELVVTGFGVINLVAVGIIAWLAVDGFASIWCAWAAVSSAAIAGYLRWKDPELLETAGVSRGGPGFARRVAPASARTAARRGCRG